MLIDPNSKSPKDSQPEPKQPEKAKGEEKPTRVERLLRAIRDEISAGELADDLGCAADAVAIVEACYVSSEQGAWVDVAALA